jgi:hypothetical protein
MIRVFIGYDAREAVAYNVLAHSLLRRSSAPLSIVPLALSSLRDVLTRERHPLQSTDFAFSRFLTPYLCGFEGWSVFMDCDMLALDDISNLWALRDSRFAVQVVKHDYKPAETTKFLGQTQTPYAKKNWSSVMLFNNAQCSALTPEYVNRASGLDLHQFKWLTSEALIGALPSRWNHLVGEYPARSDVSIVHYTLGGPYFDEYRDCEYSGEWLDERDAMLAVTERLPAPA